MKSIIKAANYIFKKEKAFIWSCFCALLFGVAFSIAPYYKDEEHYVIYNGILQNISFTNSIISLVFVNICISKLYLERNIYAFVLSGNKRKYVFLGINFVLLIRALFIMNIMLFSSVIMIWLVVGKLPNILLNGASHTFLTLICLELHMCSTISIFCMIAFCLRKIAAGLAFGWFFVILSALTPIIEHVGICDVSIKDIFGMYVIPNFISKSISNFGLYLGLFVSLMLIISATIIGIHFFKRMEFN